MGRVGGWVGGSGLYHLRTKAFEVADAHGQAHVQAWPCEEGEEGPEEEGEVGRGDLVREHEELPGGQGAGEAVDWVGKGGGWVNGFGRMDQRETERKKESTHPPTHPITQPPTNHVPVMSPRTTSQKLPAIQNKAEPTSTEASRQRRRKRRLVTRESVSIKERKAAEPCDYRR